MHRVTFNADETLVTHLKKIGKYPLKLGGFEWIAGQSQLVEDLRPFYDGDKSKKEVYYFLTVEEVPCADTEETD